MCSFLFSTKRPVSQDFNPRMKLRGPDRTSEQEINGCYFCHNLLSMRGDYIPQPHTSKCGNIVVMLNGEIYNCPEDEPSEAQFIAEAFLAHGKAGFAELDGEYAIVLLDMRRDTVYFARDCFGTKPMFVAFSGRDVASASYRSALEAMGYSSPIAAKPNHVVEVALDGSVVIETPIYHFNIAQTKSSYDDWFDAFDAAVRKRTSHMRGGAFVGLSSGYDSGAIAASLLGQEISFQAVSVLGREDQDTMAKRFLILESSGVDILRIPDKSINVENCRKWLKANVENEPYSIMNDAGERVDVGKSVHSDNAAMILTAVCAQAYSSGSRVYLSGSGADEIISDYGFQGRKIFAHSNFGGKFPENLYGLFPWASVFGSTQQAYLMKEEMVAGSFGMETRYPFLDTRLVQEYISLKAEVKNSSYKAPLELFLSARGFPVAENTKIGFGFS